MDKSKLIIRMGSHAEKEYILKLNKKFDGIIIGANVVEATAGATASLLGQKLKLPYYIDPMTYVFGCNLDGIRSEQKRNKKIVLDYKRSYKSLAQELGSLFVSVLERGVSISLQDISQSNMETICKDVIKYQLSRIRQEFMKDEAYKSYANLIPDVAGVFAPYFYISSDSSKDWNAFVAFSKLSVDIKPSVSVYSVLCTDIKFLVNDNLIEKAIKEIPETGIKGVWLWFSKFDEWDINEDYLKGLKKLVEGLSRNGLEIYNRHGGYFSLILNKVGMTGISHGVGYGEKKDVLQIEGPPNAPVVNYYLQDIHKRCGVPDIEYCFNAMNVKSPLDFYEKICDCVICKGVVESSILDFKKFGEDHYATSESKRPTQTAAAAKRCRFHFLINRIKEKEFIAANDLQTIVGQLNVAQEKWNGQITIAKHKVHLERWIKAMS
jgi:hypothetical protein